MEEIFEIRSCIEILANDIKVNTADEYMRHIGTMLYSAIHVRYSGKYRTEDKLKIHKLNTTNNTKHSKPKPTWFSLLLQLSARKRGGLILQCSSDYMGQDLSSQSRDSITWLKLNKNKKPSCR